MMRSLDRFKADVDFNFKWLASNIRRGFMGARLPRRWYPSHTLPNAASPMSNSHWAQIETCLFLGDIRAANSDKLFDDHHITHVVNSTQEVPNFFHDSRPNVVYLKMGWFDDSGQACDQLGYRRAYDFMHDAMQNDCTVLVHCQAGRSRSASIVLYYLCRSRQIHITEGLEWLCHHRWTSINQTFVECIAHTLAEDFNDPSYLGYVADLEKHFTLHY